MCKYNCKFLIPILSLVLWHINHCMLFNAKSIFIYINSSISSNCFCILKIKFWNKSELFFISSRMVWFNFKCCIARMSEYTWRKNDHNTCSKIFSHFILGRGWETDWRMEIKIHCYTGPLLLPLTTPLLSSGPHLVLLWLHVTQLEALWAATPAGARSDSN